MTLELTKAEVNAGKILELVGSAENKGRAPRAKRAEFRKTILEDLPSHLKQLNALRTPTKEAVAIDLSLGQFMNEMFGFAVAQNGGPDAFFECIGLNPGVTTIHHLVSTPDFDETHRWLVPEIIREAVKLGIARTPNYKNWIAAEESISMPDVTMPFIHESAAMPSKIGEAETIPVGNISMGQKKVTTFKVGTGIELTDEVRQFVPLNILALFLGDVGRKLNLALDNVAMDTLINGDQTDGSEAAPVIGTISGSSWSYNDLLRAWIRMGRLGRLPAGMIMNESPAMDILGLSEFKGFAGQSTTQKLELQTPVPATQKVWVTGAMPNANYLMLIDPTSALIKLNSMPLKVESQREVRKGVEGTYVSLMTGFCNMFRDARLIIQKNAAYAGFPAWMDIDGLESGSVFE